MTATANQNERHTKILAAAAGRRGCSMSLYMTEARELRDSGLIEMRQVFTATGNSDLRWFLKREAA